jgi:hypothetical protein
MKLSNTGCLLIFMVLSGPAFGIDHTLIENAEKGDAAAQTQIARLLYNGDGVRQNINAAVIWFRKAADQGYGEAQAELGMMYFTGDGVPKDRTVGLNLLKQAAEKNVGLAGMVLGSLYETGTEVPVDLAEAARWYPGMIFPRLTETVRGCRTP